MEVAQWLRVGATAAFHGVLTLRGPWGQRDGAALTGPHPPLPRRPLTWAAFLQLLHSHRLGGRWRVLHAAQQRLHQARPVGRADAYVVPRLVLQPLLACSVQAHEDGGPAGVRRGGSYRRAGGEEGGAGVWGSGDGLVGVGSGPPHVDLLLCRFSTERTVA